MSKEKEEVMSNLATAISEMHAKNDIIAKQIADGKTVSDTAKGEILALSKKVGEMSAMSERLSAIEASIPSSSAVITQDKFDANDEFQAWARNKKTFGANNALTVGTPSEAGFLVPPEMLLEINRVNETIGSMDMEARSISVSGSSTEVLMNLGGTTSGWVSETAPRPDTNNFSLSQIIIRPEEIYANVPVSQHLLDDSGVDVAMLLSQEFGIEFGLRRNDAFVNGTGQLNNQPSGYLNETIVDNAAHVKNTNIGAVATGVAGGFEAAPDGADALIVLRHSLERQYRSGGNAKFFMNDNTAAAVRLLKNTDGSYIWRDSIEADMPQSLLGSPVVIDDFLPDIAPGSDSIVYADMRRGYLIVNRTGLTVLRDPYSNKPNVDFYATMRTGGRVVDYSAIKVLRFDVAV